MFGKKQKKEDSIETIKESRSMKIKAQIKKIVGDIEAKKKEIDKKREDLISYQEIAHAFQERIDQAEKDKIMLFEKVQALETEKQKLEIELNNVENEAHIIFLKNQHIDPVAYEGILKAVHEEKSKNEKLNNQVTVLTVEINKLKLIEEKYKNLTSQKQAQTEKKGFLGIFNKEPETITIETQIINQLNTVLDNLKKGDIKSFEEADDKLEEMINQHHNKPEVKAILEKNKEKIDTIKSIHKQHAQKEHEAQKQAEVPKEEHDKKTNEKVKPHEKKHKK